MVLSENGVNKWKWENAIIIFSIVYIGAATYMLKVLLDRIYRNADITINTVLQLKLYSIRSDELTIFFRAVSWFGYNGIIVIVTALCLFCIYKKYYYKFQIVFFTTTLGGYLNTILKEIIQRSRPQLIQLTSTSGSSFPSGHAMAAIIFYGLIAYLVSKSHHFSFKRKIMVTAFCFILTLLVGFSRIYLGVHYPTDVLGGYLIGSMWLITAITIDQCVSYKTKSNRKQI